MQLDGNWQQLTRDSDGFIYPDPQAFPSGIRALADYLHSRKLKLGLYSGTRIIYILLFITCTFFVKCIRCRL